MARDKHILVLGIGNVLWADEGFGVRCVESLQREWTFADHVELMDGPAAQAMIAGVKARPSPVYAAAEPEVDDVDPNQMGLFGA